MKKFKLLAAPLLVVPFLMSCGGGNTPSVDKHVVSEQEFNNACSFKNVQYMQESVSSEISDTTYSSICEFSPTVYYANYESSMPTYSEIFVHKKDDSGYEKASRTDKSKPYDFADAMEGEFLTPKDHSLLISFEHVGITYKSFTYDSKAGTYSATFTPPEGPEVTSALRFENKKLISVADSSTGTVSTTTYTYEEKTPKFPENPGPVGYSALSKISIEADGTEMYNIVFDYFADNQYVESGTYYEDMKIYHLVEKTGDGGYVDYNVEAYPTEANGSYELYEGYIDTYNANGKILSRIKLSLAEYIELDYPGYDYQLGSIELKFADFELTKFYYTSSSEYSYDDNSNLLKCVIKELYEDEVNKVLSLATVDIEENIYDNEDYLVKRYMYDGDLTRYTYTYDVNGFLTDSDEYFQNPKGTEADFLDFINTFDVDSTSFEDYGEGYTDGYGGPYAYAYKETGDPGTFEVETFWLDEDDMCHFEGHVERTYGENGSYVENTYDYTEPEDEGQPRASLQFIDLTLGELTHTRELAYDNFQNCIKDLDIYISGGEPSIVWPSYEYTVAEGKITQYDYYVISNAAANCVAEYTTTNNDYGQTFGWVYKEFKGIILG